MPLTGVRHELRKLRVANPHWSLGDFAAVLHVTRERVRQLLASEGLDTRRRTPRRIMQEALDRASTQAQAPHAVATGQADTNIVMPLHNALPSAQTAGLTVPQTVELIAEVNSGANGIGDEFGGRDYD